MKIKLIFLKKINKKTCFENDLKTNFSYDIVDWAGFFRIQNNNPNPVPKQSVIIIIIVIILY